MAEGMMAERISEDPRSKEMAGELRYEASKTGRTKRTSLSDQAAERSKRGKVPLVDDRDELDAFVQANEAIMKGMAALSSEMMEFGKRRLDQYTERSESLVGCQDAEQAVSIESDFAQTATLQYLDHTYSLLGILARMTEEFLTPLQEHARQTLRDLAKETGQANTPERRPE